MPRDFSADFPKNWNLSINGILCGIYVGPDGNSYGISEGHGPDGRRATVYFQCFWDDREDLVAGLLGTVDYQGNTIIRNDPTAYPLANRDSLAESGNIYPNRMFCTGISSITGTKAWEDETGDNVGQAFWLGYCYAIVQAEFTCPPYLIEDLDGPGIPPSDPSFNDLSYQTYCVSNIRVSGEVFSPPTGAFVFASGAFSGNPLLDVGASQIRTRSEITITRVRMPLIPMQTIGPLIGTVNQLPFQVGGQLFPMGSMLFNGINPTPRSDPYNCGIVWDIEHTWLGNSPANTNGVVLDWNYFLDPGGVWSKVTTKGGDPVFAYADHTVVFQDAIT